LLGSKLLDLLIVGFDLGRDGRCNPRIDPAVEPPQPVAVFPTAQAPAATATHRHTARPLARKQKAFRFPKIPLDWNIIRTMFSFRSKRQESWMIRAIVEEAATLTSLALFLGMVAIWAQVFATL
jgi:hypothetical protein